MELNAIKSTEAGTSKLLARLEKSRKRGLTLIEAAMVLAVLALVVAGIMMFYTSANTSRQTTQSLNELASIQQAIRTLYGGQSSYTGLNNAALVNTSVLSSSMIQGTGIRNAFNGAVTVAPADAGGGANSGFSVQFSNIPSEACSRLVTSDLGQGLWSVQAGGQTRSQSGGNPPPFNPADAGGACGAASNQITWIFQ